MDAITFEDVKGNWHCVNPAYIVQLYTNRYPKWDNSGVRIGEYKEYLVNVANAGVACYNAQDYEVNEETFQNLIEKWQTKV